MVGASPTSAIYAIALEGFYSRANMYQVSSKTVQQFQAMLKLACQRNPNQRFVDVVVKWRGAKELNHTSIRVLNYCSYLIESRPGIGSTPIGVVFMTM